MFAGRICKLMAVKLLTNLDAFDRTAAKPVASVTPGLKSDEFLDNHRNGFFALRPDSSIVDVKFNAMV